jgi:hypothetical protein
LRERTDAQAPPPAGPDDKPPADPGLVPLSVHEVKRLLAAALTRAKPPGHAARWLHWRRRHQARSRWFHKRTRLEGYAKPSRIRSKGILVLNIEKLGDTLR